MKLINLFSCFSCHPSHDSSPVHRSSVNRSNLQMPEKKKQNSIQILPDELFLNIFDFFLATPKEFATINLTHKAWYQLLKESSLKSAECFYLYQTLPKSISLPDANKITRNTWHTNHNLLERNEHLAFYYKISILEDPNTSFKSFSIQKRPLRGENDFPLSGNEVCIFKDKVSRLSIERVRSDAYPDTEERTVGLELASPPSEPKHLSCFERAAIQCVLTTLNKTMQEQVQKVAPLKKTKK